MNVRSVANAERLLLAVLGLGLSSFVLLYSLVLFWGQIEQTFALSRQVWFVGFAVVVVSLAYVTFS